MDFASHLETKPMIFLPIHGPLLSFIYLEDMWRELFMLDIMLSKLIDDAL